MSFKTAAKSCSDCHAYLFEDDDVVHCPVCGAPHHRACWERQGHCALEALHGTAQQYDLQQEQKNTQEADRPETADIGEEAVCGKCGHRYDPALFSCPQCGMPRVGVQGVRFAAVDPLGGVPASADLGLGVTAEEAGRFVVANTHRYVPKFAAFFSGVKHSWNWAAFFFPSTWMLARKMYKPGLLTAVLSVAFSLLILPFNAAVSYLDTGDMSRYYEALQQAVSELVKENPTLPLMALIGMLLSMILRFVVGFYGDRLYYRHVLKTVSNIKTEEDADEYAYERKGGVSFLMILVGYAAISYLPAIIGSFIM